MAELKATDLKTYGGNCHCGAFKFTVETAPLTRVLECNCSNCSRNGVLWIFPFSKEEVVVERGSGTLKEYMMNPEKGNVVILFCPKCGTSVMERKRDESLVLNVRTFTDVDLNSLELFPYDGASKMLPLYVPPAMPIDHDDTELEDGLKLYNGNCHCGAVQYTVKSKPLEDIEVVSCNCSLCSRNGELWIYPSKSAVKIYGEDALVGYEFLHKDSLHSFCGTCGVSVLVTVTVPGADIVPLNVRTMNGVKLDSLKLKKYDGWAQDPQYVVA